MQCLYVCIVISYFSEDECMKTGYMIYLDASFEEAHQYPGINREFANRDYDKEAGYLYAVTVEKSIYEEFSTLRNKKLFRKKTISLSKEDVESFIGEYEPYLLEYHLLKTATLNEFSNYESEVITILMTQRESDLVYDNRLIYQKLEQITSLYIFSNYQKMSVFEAVRDFMQMFKGEYQDALRRLDFYDIVSSVITYGESSDVEFGSEFQIDYLGIFLELFGNTFRTRVRPKRRMK